MATAKKKRIRYERYVESDPSSVTIIRNGPPVDESEEEEGVKTTNASKASIARESAVRVAEEIQGYSEHNKEMLARAIGGEALKGNGPMDVVVKIGGTTHGVELKTMTVQKNDKVTMHGDAIERKKAWERKNKAKGHTVIFDDSEVFNANGPGKHDYTKRRILYYRGYGSIRTGNMKRVDSVKDLKKLLGRKQNEENPAKTRKEVANLTLAEFQEAAVPTDDIEIHGMTDPEPMWSVEVDSVDIVFNENSAEAAYNTVRNAAGIGDSLWNQNERVVFTTQEAKGVADDWPDFVGAASGGDGSIVVYGGRSLSPEILTRESARNLAFNFLGDGGDG